MCHIKREVIHLQKMVASVSFGQIPSLSFKKHIFVVENISAGEAGP